MAAGSHIADGYARPTSAEQREAYLAAKRALLRLETELAVARHAELLPAAAFAELSARSNHVSRLLTGYLVYLDRQLADGTARPSIPARGPAAAITPDSVRAPS